MTRTQTARTCTMITRISRLAVPDRWSAASVAYGAINAVTSEWQDLHLFRPGAGHAYAHIDALFSGTIDWALITEHLPDMLSVALSIKAGRLLPSAILRRLGTYSRKNRLYFTFRELGRAVRTTFLLRYVGSVDLRRTIGAATNKANTSTATRNGRNSAAAGS